MLSEQVLTELHMLSFCFKFVKNAPYSYLPKSLFTISVKQTLHTRTQLYTYKSLLCHFFHHIHTLPEQLMRWKLKLKLTGFKQGLEVHTINFQCWPVGGTFTLFIPASVHKYKEIHCNISSVFINTVRILRTRKFENSHFQHVYHRCNSFFNHQVISVTKKTYSLFCMYDLLEMKKKKIIPIISDLVCVMIS